MVLRNSGFRGPLVLGTNTELHAAQARGEVRLKEPLIQILGTDAGEGSTAYLTTNWDLCLDAVLADVAGSAKVVHLHGDIREPTGMLLPGERPEERYRRGEENAGISKAYYKASLMFGIARRIYVAGLSLSLLDAALGTLLGLGCTPQKPGEIVIVNLRRETERIGQQIKALVPSSWSIRELPSD